MAQRIRPTYQSTELHPTQPYIDVSIESPDVQYAALSAMLEAEDLKDPAPYTNTPPWGEPIAYEEYVSEGVQEEAYLPAPDMEAVADTPLLPLIEDAHPPDYPANTYWNDPQYHGLAVPPGVPNYGQPIESGHTQITLPNPSAELGWDAWSGKFVIARVPRQENSFDGYSAGTSRGHNIRVRELMNKGSAVYFTQQQRDLLLSELMKRGLHNVVVADIPSESYTEQVMQVDPSVYAEQPEIGEAGVLP